MIFLSFGNRLHHWEVFLKSLELGIMWRCFSGLPACVMKSYVKLTSQTAVTVTSLTDTNRSAPLTNPLPVLCHLDAKSAKLVSHPNRPRVNSSQYICQVDALHMPTSRYSRGNPETTMCQSGTSVWPAVWIPRHCVLGRHCVEAEKVKSRQQIRVQWQICWFGSSSVDAISNEIQLPSPA